MDSIFDVPSVMGHNITDSDLSWDLQPYPETEGERLPHQPSAQVRNPIRFSSDSLTQVNPRPFSRFTNGNLVEETQAEILARMLSTDLAYSHWGVGEKGPASRSLADSLNTYEENSLVNPLKAALLAEMQLATMYSSNNIKREAKKIINTLTYKYPISKRELSHWIRNNSVTRNLRKKGILLSEVKRDLTKLEEEKMEHKIFLSPKERKEVLPQKSFRGATKESVKHTYENSTEHPKTLRVTDQASSEGNALREQRVEAPDFSPASNVILTMKEASVNIKALDRHLTKKLVGHR